MQRKQLAVGVLFVMLIAVLAVGFLIPRVGELVERPFARISPNLTPDGTASGLVLGGTLGLLYLPCGGPILAAIFPILWFVLKVLAFLLLFIWVRGTLPRFRYDQLMSFGWKFLLPVAMANIIITSLIIALRS